MAFRELLNPSNMEKINRQQGQTLVETMVAVFILVMGITAAAGLAIYSLNATSLVNKQVAAMGLAREGVEALKNMRDTNWLQARSFDGSCNCYTDWLTSYYSLQSLGGQTLTLDFTPYDSQPWVLTVETKNFRLSYDGQAQNGRFYFPNTNGGTASDFYRRITLEQYSSAPYDGVSPRITATVDVWWNDKKCPEATTYENSKPSCRVRLQTYLTNWRNY